MKKVIYFIFLFSLSFSVFAQQSNSGLITEVELTETVGKNVKSWNMFCGKNQLGTIYSLEKNATCEIKFSPKQTDLTNATLALTGTYTSEGMKVAGTAYNNCQQIGNQQDKYFKPNSYLVFQNGKVAFSDQQDCNAISIYKVIDNGTVLSDFIDTRTKKSFQWRFFVEKKWTKQYENGNEEHGTDFLIVDFEPIMTLAEACAYVKGLERNDKEYYTVNVRPTYEKFHLTTTVTAGLLDTGMYRPLLVNGKNVAGEFPKEQSNVLVIK